MPESICRKFLVVFLFLFLPLFVFAQTGLVNINTAGSTELQTLNGIGPSKAQAIIDYRTQNGLFQKIEDIKKVSGIGDVTYANIKDYITVGTVEESNTGSNSSTTTATTTEQTTTTNTSTDSNPSSNSSNSSNQPVSVHYSSGSLSTKKPQINISLSAGRDRLGSVGSPLSFKAETNLNYIKNTSFKWNFGDGSEGYGENVTRAYEYPGEYVVILNASLPDGQAISRVNVKIVEGELLVASADKDKIEIKNNSTYEVSLFGRALVALGNSFVFPQDTVIKPGQSIFFSSKITNLRPLNRNQVSIMVIGETEPAKMRQKIEEKKSEQIALLQNQLLNLQSQLSNMYVQTVSVPRVAGTSTTVQGASVKPEVSAGIVSTSTNASSTGKITRWMQTLKKFFSTNNR